MNILLSLFITTRPEVMPDTEASKALKTPHFFLPPPCFVQLATRHRACVVASVLGQKLCLQIPGSYRPDSSDPCSPLIRTLRTVLQFPLENHTRPSSCHKGASEQWTCLKPPKLCCVSEMRKREPSLTTECVVDRNLLSTSARTISCGLVNTDLFTYCPVQHGSPLFRTQMLPRTA